MLLLTTKLEKPRPRPALVHRAHLLDQLNSGLDHCRLTVIAAPAGFGKTTLLSDWMARCDPGLGVAWLALDQGDNDPARFIAYLQAALQTAAPGIGEKLAAYAQSPDMESILTALINDVAHLAPHRVVLILDDFHLVSDKQVHDSVAFLAEHQPANLHLIVAARADPPLPLARLRARGQLAELRQADLRFSAEEAADFLNQVMGLELSPKHVAALVACTEGWIAGLQLAAISMQGRDDAAAFVQAFAGSNRYILDYLMEEVLQRQPQAVQEFLLRTSILDRLAAPLCDEVMGVSESVNGESANQRMGEWARGESAQSILDYLERANLFVVPLDDRREWYRYHRLFADLLRKRLQQLWPGLIPEIHRRASAWCERNDLVSEAIDHALAAGDFERAAGLIEQIAEATLKRSEGATLRRWVDALPAESLAGRPTVSVFYAWALMLGGRPWTEIQSALEGVDAEALSGSSAPLQAFVATIQGRFSRARELSHQALEHLPEDQQFLRAVAAWNMSIAQAIGADATLAFQSFDEVIRQSQAAGNVMVAVMALCNRAELCMALGQLHLAHEGYQRAMAMATDAEGGLLPVAGMALNGLGELQREWNDLDAATEYLTQGIELSRRWGDFGTLDGYTALSLVKQAQGDEEGARWALEQAREVAVNFDVTELDDFGVALIQARLWLAQGNVEAVERWLGEQGPLARSELARVAEDDAYLRFQFGKYESIVRARVLLARERPDEALAILEPLALAVRERGGIRREIELQVLRALALDMLGRVDDALAALDRALSLGEPSGFVRMFVDEGESLAHLLYQALQRGISPQYVGKLLAAFGVATAPPADARPVEALIEPLSDRELEVLELIAHGLSNREIAQRLVLSLRTVKWHTGNIYGKLEVNSRTQAVARARALGILSRL